MNIPERLTNKISSAKRIVFFTGAGISAESGIPVFRGKDGIWNKLKPEELANFNAFLKNPELVWEWYQHRKKIVSGSGPNAGHLAIMEMENYFPDVKVITQNIDNLHKRAGSKTIYELHGNIERNYCIKCKKVYYDIVPLEGKTPKCECGGLIRPNVVWFGEYLPQDQFDASYLAAENADIFFIVGTSAIVYPAASLIYKAKESGAALVEVNIERTEISGIVDFSLFGKAGEVLPAVLNSIKELKN
ncbi:MAG: NAD-dependent deacylase [Ignavibacteriaceae bacterium]